MTRKIVLGIAIAATLIAGTFAITNANNAIAGFFDPTVRDNVTVNDIKLKDPQIMVIVDNAGVGTVSDFEITWRFDPTKCFLAVATLPAPALGLVPIVDDGALGGNPAHADFLGGEAVVLGASPGKTCKIDSKKGSFVTVSTVAADSERDTTIITKAKIAAGDRMFMVDNLGIAGPGIGIGTSDVEVVWRFSDPDCKVVTSGGAPSGTTGAASSTLPALPGTLILADDTALGGAAAHSDVTTSDGIFLAGETGPCNINSKKGDFVTVSTVMSTP